MYNPRYFNYMNRVVSDHFKIRAQEICEPVLMIVLTFFSPFIFLKRGEVAHRAMV